jgi:hypothetical protein
MDVQMPDGTIVTGVPDDITQQDLLARYSAYTPPSVTENPIYGVAANITPSLAQGIGGLMQFPGRLADLATGTAPGEEEGIGRKIVGTLLPFTNKGAQRAGEGLQQIGREAKTLGLQQKEKERAELVAQQEGQVGKFVAAFADTVTDPTLLSSFLFEQIPNTVGSMGGGLLAKGAATLLFKNASQKALANVGISGAVGTGVAMQGADIGYDTYKDIYERLVKEGMAKDEANLIAVQKGRVAAIEAGALSYATSKIPGAREVEKLMFKKALSPADLAKSGSKAAIAKGAGKGAFGETLGENIEEIGGQFASNIGKQEVFPETRLTEGLGEAAAMATIGGVTLGGVSGGINARRERQSAIDQEADFSQPKTVIDPETGIKRIYSPVPIDDPTLELGGTPEINGRKVYIYREKPLEAEQETTATTPASPQVAFTGNEALDREAMMAEINGEQLPLAAPPAAPVAQPAQITQTGNVQVTPPGEPVSTPPAAPIAQPAQIPLAENVQPSAEDIVPLNDKGEPIKAPKSIAPPKAPKAIDPNVEAQLAAEPFDPDSIILPPKEIAPPPPAAKKPKAPKVAQVYYGKDAAGNTNVPVSEGGLPFTTKAEAEKIKALQPELRVQKVKGGWLLGEKSEQYKAADKLRAQNLTKIDTPGLIGDILRMGGLDPAFKSYLGFGEKENPSIGNRRLFAAPGKGVAPETVTEMYMEDRPDEAEFTGQDIDFEQSLPDRIKAELKRIQSGERIETPEQAYERRQEEDALEYEAKQDELDKAAQIEAKDVSAEVAAEQAVEASGLEDFRQQMLDAGYTEQDLNVIGFTKASPELQAEVAALEKQVTEAGLDPSGILESLSRTYGDRLITKQEYYAKAKDELAKAIREKAVQGGGRDASKADVQEGAEREEGLVSPSEQELKAKQEAVDKAAADKAKADRDAEAKAKADAERKDIAARSEKAAGEFELGKTAEEDLSGQKDVFSTPVQISPEQQKLDALNKFEENLAEVVPTFRAASSTGTSVLRPKPLNTTQIALIKDLAGEAIDLGMPSSLLEYVSAAGATRMSAVAAIASRKGWLLLGKDWSSTTRVEKLKAIIHEIAHSVDNAKARISGDAAWQKANDELKQWYDSSTAKKEHSLSYPFDRQFNGKVRVNSESFAQSFALYFVSPVELQTNAPEAYSQIQSIVEGIQNESQRASTASATKAVAAGVKVQPSRSAKGAEVQSEVGEVGAGVSKAERVKDRADQGVDRGAKSAKPKLSEDIPNERWLQGKVDYAIEKGRNRYGVPHMSTVTGYFDKPVQVPLRVLSKLKGETDEQNNVRQSSLDYIRKNWDEVSKSPPYIEVAYNGEAYVSEGNHRIMVAIEKGLDSMPVEIRYFDGGQRKNGPLNPSRIPSLDSSVDEQVSESRGKAKQVTDTKAFKDWFGDSKVVDEDGKPLLMYHATESEFSEFDTKRRAIAGEGSFFSSEPLESFASGEGGNIMPVYLSLKNPKVIKMGRDNDDILKAKFIREGYDGVILTWDGRILTAVAFYPEQIKSQFNKGTFSPETVNISESLAPAKWVDPDITWKDTFIRKVADRHNDLKTVQKAITEQVGNLRGNVNAYQIQDLAHGRIQTQTADFLDFEFVPILKEMQEKGITDPELTKYLLARHAEEANKVIAERNKNDPLMQDGGSGMDTDVAQKYLASLAPAKKAALESIAKKVDNILALTREMLEANGIISKEEREGWESMFQHYVPLQREQSDYALPSNSYKSVGKFSKSRTGSTGKSVIDILANVGINREVAIVRIEKERVKRAVYGLAVTNPNPEIWKAVSPDAIKNKTVLAQELREMGISAADVGNILSEPTTRYFNKETGQVESRVDTMKRYADFVLPVKINGKDRFIFFNPQNPRAMAMVTALKDMDVQALEGAVASVANVTRFFAAVNTQYNLVFGLFNFARDLQGSMFNLTTTPIADKKAEVAKGSMKALPEIYKALRERNAGKTPSDTKDGSWYDFISHGGKVGYRDQFAKVKESTTLVDREFAKLDRGSAKRRAYALLNWVSNVNDVLENAVRLSSYRVALDKYKSEAKGKISDAQLEEMKANAAEIAKNITVNFNTKGNATGMIGALYAFTNASIRGTARLIETVDPRTSRGRKIMGALVTLGAVQAVALAMAGFDDDEPSEFIKQKNLVIPLNFLGIEGKKYFMIPMPYGLNVFPNLGRLMVEGSMSISKGRGVKDQVANTIGMLFTAFNPIGGGAGALAFSPTALDPAIAIIQNRDAFDRPITRENRSTKPTPGYLRSRDQSASVSQFIAEFLNTITGGTSYTKGLVSPTADQINYLAEQVGGGVYREGSRFVKYAADKATGEQTPDYRVPLAGKIVGDLDSPAAISQKFYSNVIRMSEHEDEIKGRQSKRESPTQYMKDNPEAFLWRQTNTLENELSKINRRRRELIAKDAPKDQIKKLEDQRTRMMKQFNDRVRKYD